MAGPVLLVEKLESSGKTGDWEAEQSCSLRPWSYWSQCSAHLWRQIRQTVDFVSSEWHKTGVSVIQEPRLTTKTKATAGEAW